MNRLNYYVVDAGREWEVRSDAEPDVAQARCASCAEALLAALQRARDAWRAQHRPTGVRVQDLLGRWREEATFGFAPRTGEQRAVD
jgi:hypothetical protein